MPPSPSPPPSSLDHRKNKTRDSSFLQLSWKKYISGGKLQSIYWSERKIYFIDTPHLTARIDLHKNSDKAKHVSKRGGEGAVEVEGGGYKEFYCWIKICSTLFVLNDFFDNKSIKWNKTIKWKWKSISSWLFLLNRWKSMFRKLSNFIEPRNL